MISNSKRYASQTSSKYKIEGTIEKLQRVNELTFTIISFFSFVDAGGCRSFAVGELMNAEPDFLHFGLWITSVSAISGAIVSTLIGAFMSIVNTAITPVQPMAARTGLYILNVASR